MMLCTTSECDVLTDARRHFAYLNYGFVDLVDVMPRIVDVEDEADECIVDAARVSYSHGIKKRSTSEKLLRYLMRHEHMTPFEMVEVKFCLKVPLFVARQLFRHRTCSFNEESARYSEVQCEFYEPSVWRAQSTENKQGSSNILSEEGSAELLKIAKANNREAYFRYQQMLKNGVAREQARMILPQSMFTTFYMKMNLRNFFHLCELRLDKHTQLETRVAAILMYELVKPVFPRACAAFEEYMKNSMRLSATEVAILQMPGPWNETDQLTGRELNEWQEKCKVLFGQ